MSEFQLPDLGEGIEQAEIVSVMVKEGDVVEKGTPVFVVESDKASIDIPADFSGTISAVLVKQGSQVAIGQALLNYGSADSGSSASSPPPETGSAGPGVEKAASAAEPAPPSTPAPPPVTPAGPAENQPTSPEPASASSTLPPAENWKPGDLPAGIPEPSVAGEIPASPMARRYARESGLSLNGLKGSGLGSRITVEDVKKAAATQQSAIASSASAAPSAQGASSSVEGSAADRSTTALSGNETAAATSALAASGATEVMKLSATRKTIARRMVENWNQIPHVMHQVKADITEVENLRRRNVDYAEKHHSKLSGLVFVLKALVACLKKYPVFNAEFDEATESVILKKYYNIGIAVDTPGGLIVPVIRNVDRLSILQIGEAVSELALAARDGRLGPADFRDHTFSVSNLGAIGGSSFTPIINAPDTAILGVMRGVVEPVFNNGSFVPRTMLPLNLSYDHRVIDGADAARFMNDLAENLSNPEKLFLNT